MIKDSAKKLGWKKDWSSLFYLAFASIGFIVSIYDFWKLQNLSFQIGVFLLPAILLFVMGGTLRITSRKALLKAGFTMLGSGKLQIVENQRLITHGVYGHIRHPLYLGEITRNLGFALLFSSLYGLIIMIIASPFLIWRIHIEEKMLISEFGKEYEEYTKKTKKLIPYIY